MTRWGRSLGLVALVFLTSCNPPPTTADAAVDANGTSCALDRDCDDGLFCNGIEVCVPGAGDADLHGCRHGAIACASPLTCNESTDACIADCEDADHDGHGAIACGGDDCDDTNAERFPGHVEVCDAGNVDEDCDPSTFGDRDLDGDGSIAAICCNGSHCGPDCDDFHRDASPNAPEVCDSVDNDCDGATDEGLILPQFLDGDHDGIGDASRPLTACPGTPGVSAVTGDCDDTRASVRPTAPEICDGMDNDCDTDVDEHAVAVPWYVDADHDGWGVVSPTQPSIESCVPPQDRVIRPGDCDDANAMVSPSAAEVCNGVDDDCNGRADYFIAAHDTEDDDLDGYADMACGLATNVDCNDGDPLDSVPGTPELCDFHDNDCDGRIDENTAPGEWYGDVDGDGFGDPGSAPIHSCTLIPGRVRDATDCDDADRGTHPHAVDSCTTRLGVDDDCDGTIDEGGAHITLFVDMDDDHYGVGMPFASCLQDTHSATRDGDCDDANALVNPGEHDDCSGVTGVDDDCNGLIDEITTTPTFFADADSDGFGAGAAMATCSPPAGAVDHAGDCDDANALRNPLVPDDCATSRGVDDDCDGSIDEAAVLHDYFIDLDHDGFGAGAAMPACAPPTGTSSLGGDCDDASAMRNPGAPDDCSRPMGVDDDCDGTIDEAAMFVTLYRDVDGDTYGSGSGVLACGTLAGYVTRGGDCNESAVAVNPGRLDDCNTQLGVDDDCDTRIDEAVVLTSWYADADGDGYGVGAAMMACRAPTGFVANATDCDDANRNRSPGRPDDCTGASGVDDDCDARVDEGAASMTYHRDADGDGFGDPTLLMLGCAATSGYVLDGTDCNDASASAHPGGTETVASSTCADAIDQDCDGRIDCADSGCVTAPSCGSTIQVLSGDMQSAVIHGALATPMVVRMTDGSGAPLGGRSITLATTSVTATGYTAVTDASGQATFTLRAGLALGPESITFRGLGVPDAHATVTGTAPPTGRIFSVFNGLRRPLIVRSGPAWDATTGAQFTAYADVEGANDGAIFFATASRILRIRTDGSVESIVGGGTIWPPQVIEEMPASLTNLDDVSNMALGYDDVRQVLYFTRNCAIYSVDLATLTAHRVLGQPNTCAIAGDGARALDATSTSIFDISVDDTGLLFFSSGGEVIRMIDTGGSVTHVLTGSTTISGIVVGFVRRLAAIDGSSDVLFGADCRPPGMPGSGCVLRSDPAGNITVVAGGGSDTTEGALATNAWFANLPWEYGFDRLSTGEIVITTNLTATVHRVDATGHITTLVGTLNMPGAPGDGGPSTSALVRTPFNPAAWRGSHVVFLDTSSSGALRAVW